jgi:uncharacterized protein (TIGR04255 family)
VKETVIQAGNSRLPEFDDPPVIETVLGLEFEPIQGWDVRHFGLLWAAGRHRFPHFEVQPPLSLPVPGAPFSNMMVEYFGVSPKLRAWYIDESQTRLIQIQEDRFLHNWRKVLGTEEYPRYEENIRPSFSAEWERFREFLRSNSLPEPLPRRWEVTYVNHIEWQPEFGVSQLHDVLSFVSRPVDGGFLPDPDELQVMGRFAFGETGHLTVTAQPVLRRRDEQAILQINLTATGPIRADDTGEVAEYLDIGREWVVKGFADITSEKMHTLWRKRDL